MRMVDAEYKLEKNIKIAMLYLEDDDAVNAETFIKKAASLITNTKVKILLCKPLSSQSATCQTTADARKASRCNA
jgi:hypothetical protein